jgi:hypothetical protein
MLKFFLFLVSAHALSWLISCGPLLSKRVYEYRWLVCLLGVLVTYLFMEATRAGFDTFGRLWTAKLLGFCVSTVVFTVMTYSIMGESPSPRDFVCLALAALIVLIRVV